MRSVSIISILTIALLFTGFSLLTEEFGLAASYDDSFHGSGTASKEKYDTKKLTGAHKTLPFGTLVKVTRLDNKKSVKVRINDRGPYLSNRIIEISRKAANQIGLAPGAVTQVKIEEVGTARAEDPEPLAKAAPVTTTAAEASIENPTPSNFDNSAALAEKAAKEKAAKERADAEKAAKEKANKSKAASEKAAAEKAAIAAATVAIEKAAKKVAAPAAKAIDNGVPATRVRGRDFAKYDLYKVQILRPERTGFGVQVASLTDYANVMRQVAELQEKWFNNILISVEEGPKKVSIYKIMLGPFPDRTTAKSYEKDLKRKKKIDGFIVDLSSVKY